MEEDIKILEEFLTENRDWKCIECGFNCQNEVKAIENVLSELEIYKKIAKFLSTFLIERNLQSKCRNCEIELISECEQCIIEWARKEVENG